VRDDLRTFGGGMDAVGLDGAGDVDQVFVDHGHEGGVVLGGQFAEELIELPDVLLAVIGRQRDAGEQRFHMSGFESGEHLVEIAARLGERQAAQAVVAAEFDNDDSGMQRQNGAQIGDGVFGGCAAGALIDDFVVKAVSVKVALQGVGEGLAGLEAISGGDAVSVADQERSVGGSQWSGDQQNQTKRNKQ